MMDQPLIIVSSITYAYKAKSVLEKSGIKAYIERPPIGSNTCGCRYAIRLRDAEEYETAYELLKSSGVRIMEDGGSSS